MARSRGGAGGPIVRRMTKKRAAKAPKQARKLTAADHHEAARQARRAGAHEEARAHQDRAHALERA